MNREIKFRAWNGTKMVHLNLFQGEHHEDDFYLIDQDVEGGYIDDKPAQVSWPIMQYAGLKDKNGVEIYEGDIIKWYYRSYAEPCITTVNYHNDSASFDIPNFEYDDEGKESGIEIIGNIYQHPELINKP